MSLPRPFLTAFALIDGLRIAQGPQAPGSCGNGNAYRPHMLTWCRTNGAGRATPGSRPRRSGPVAPRTGSAGRQPPTVKLMVWSLSVTVVLYLLDQ